MLVISFATGCKNAAVYAAAVHAASAVHGRHSSEELGRADDSKTTLLIPDFLATLLWLCLLLHGVNGDKSDGKYFMDVRMDVRKKESRTAYQTFSHSSLQYP